MQRRLMRDGPSPVHQRMPGSLAPPPETFKAAHLNVTGMRFSPQSCEALLAAVSLHFRASLAICCACLLRLSC